MSKTTVLPTHENLIDVVAGTLASTQSDLSRCMVVFPGKRPAHFLRKKLSEIIKTSFIPPAIFSMDTFIEFMAKEKLGTNSRVIHSLDAVSVLFEIHQSMQDKIGGEHFTTIDRFLPLGMKMFGELEELMLAHVEHDDIQAHVRGIPFGKLNLLAEYYEKFYQELSSRQCSSRAMSYASVARQIDRIDLSECSLCIFAGFYLQTIAEKRIFANLHTRSNIEFIYQRVEGFSLSADTVQEKTVCHPDADMLHTEIHYIKAPDTHGQIFALSALLKERIERNEHLDEHCTIVLPAVETLTPLLDESLALLPKDEFNIALGYPLSRTPIYGFISTLIELVALMREDKIPAAAYLAFVLHPYTKNIRYRGKSEVTRVLMHTVEEYLANNQTKRFLKLEEIESWTQMLDAAAMAVSGDNGEITCEDIRALLISIHNHTIRLLIKKSTVGEFARSCIKILMYIYEESTASLHPLFRRYVEKIIEVFESIESSFLGNTRFDTGGAYASLLKHYVASEDVPFSGTPLTGVQVLGLLETRNLQFDTVFMLDVNEGILPPARGEDMLLPQVLRQTLGLETYREREKLVEYYFQQLLQKAKNIYLFFTESQSGEYERSRFIQKLLWKQEKETELLLEETAVTSVQYRIKLANEKPRVVRKTQEIAQYLHQMEISATKLDTYLHCPLQFYYRYVLRLTEREVLSDELDQRDVGELVHVILRELFFPFTGQALTRAMIETLPLEEYVTREFRKRFGDELSGDQHLMRFQVLHQLDRFLKQYQLPLLEKEDVIILGVEQDLRTIENGVVLHARYDRIERRNDTRYIIDYKISGNSTRFAIHWPKLVLEERSSWNRAIHSLQLAFYLHVYQLHCGSQNEYVNPMYVLLGKNTISSDIEAPLFKEVDKRIDQYTILTQIIHSLIQEIQDPSIDFYPSYDLSTVCPHCPFAMICGTTWVPGYNFTPQS